MSDADKDLLERARQGQKEAFGQLANRYYEMVYAVAFGVVNNREIARDAAQDAFLKAYRELHRFEGKSSFKIWLYRITVNAAIDLARKKRPMESLDPTDAADEEEDRPAMVLRDRSLGPRDRAAQSELRERMNQALQQLSEDHRSVLVLREWQELSYEEIAKALDIQVGTVMSRLFYARKKLAEVLKIEEKEQELKTQNLKKQEVRTRNA